MDLYINNTSIDGLAYDWTSNVTYLIFGTTNEIRVVHAIHKFTKVLYTAHNGVFSPTKLIVDPHHG